MESDVERALRAILAGVPGRLPRTRRTRRRRHRSWSLTLLVKVDDEGLFHPSVLFLGSPLPKRARVRLELVDERGEVHPVGGAALPPSAIGTEVPLPRFAPPAGASADEVVRWRWDVVLGKGGPRHARWSRRLSPAGVLNAEAELESAPPL